MGDALVDDIGTHFGQTVDVGLTGTVVATFDGVVEQAVNRVAVVLVVLGCIDTTLGSNGVGAARRVLYAEIKYLKTHFAERSGSRGAG